MAVVLCSPDKLPSISRRYPTLSQLGRRVPKHSLHGHTITNKICPSVSPWGPVLCDLLNCLLLGLSSPVAVPPLVSTLSLSRITCDSCRRPAPGGLTRFLDRDPGRTSWASKPSSTGFRLMLVDWELSAALRGKENEYQGNDEYNHTLTDTFYVAV